MEIALIAVGFAALGVSAWIHFRSIKSLERPEMAPPPAYDDRAILVALDQLQAKVADLDGLIGNQNLAIAEGIERVDRSERRVKAAVSRAQERLRRSGYEDDSLEAEAEGLRLVDGDSSEQRELLPLSESMGEPSSDAGRVDRFSFLPGSFTDDDLFRMNGG